MPGTAALPQNSAVAMYLALALLIIFARGLGELAIKLKQPAIVGEVRFAEILLTIEDLTWNNTDYCGCYSR